MPGPGTSRTAITRHADRGVPDEAAEIIAAGRVAHVAYVLDGEPRVMPFLYGVEPGRIILHGAHGGTTLKAIRDGERVVVSIALLDAVIASKDAESHSAAYRSAVVYGRTRRIRDMDEKARLLDSMTQRYFPGRTLNVDYAEATESQMKAMDVVEILVEETSGKARRGGPTGPRDDDPSAPGSAFVQPVNPEASV